MTLNHEQESWNEIEIYSNSKKIEYFWVFTRGSGVFCETSSGSLGWTAKFWQHFTPDRFLPTGQLWLCASQIVSLYNKFGCKKKRSQNHSPIYLPAQSLSETADGWTGTVIIHNTVMIYRGNYVGIRSFSAREWQLQSEAICCPACSQPSRRI